LACSESPAPAVGTTEAPLRDGGTIMGGRRMNGKFAIAVVVMFIGWLLEGFVVHGWILRQEYMQLANLFRPESEQANYFPWMLLAHLILAFAFVWIYTKGKEAKPWLSQGARFGLIVSLLATTPTYLIYFAIQPMPGNVVAMQIVLDTVGSMLMGVIVAFIYREPVAAAAAA
jgi:hypothetical protein